MENKLPNFLESLTGRRPVVLLMLDGWGISQTRENNAIRLAKIPNFKKIVSSYPATTLKSLGENDSASYEIIGCAGKDHAWNLGQKLASAGLKQLKIAETEKFALVTNFFNSSDKALSNEDQILIPSASSVEGVDYKMATALVTKRLIKEIKSGKYDFILTSLANIDSVSHQSDLKTTIKALDYLDKYLGKISEAVLAHGGILLISASHGYAEEVFNIATNLGNRHNSDNPVPLIFVGEDFVGQNLGLPEAPENDLALIEPTGDLTLIAQLIAKIFSVSNGK